MSIDPVLQKLDYTFIEMLQLLQGGSSFKDIADHLGWNERTVSRQLLDANKAFEDSRKVRIIDRVPGKKSYQLTKAGVVLASALSPAGGAMRQAVSLVTAETTHIPVLCTSNCLGYLAELSNVLPANCGFDIVPLPKRTAEIDLKLMGKDPEVLVSLFSALMSSEQNPSVGRVTAWDDRIDVLPLSLGYPQLITRENLGFTKPVTVREVIEAGVTFLTPPGGVVWDFLDRSFPGWARLRPYQHVSVPDLEYGFKCLSTDAVQKAAMVVHNFDKLAESKLGGTTDFQALHVHDFATSSDHQLLAVTGAYRVRHEDDNENFGPYEIIWKAALDTWGEKERVI